MAEEVPMATPQDTPVYLKERESLRLRDGVGVEVRCLLGNLWVTEEGEREDRILNRGQSFVLDRPGLSLVTALGGPAMLVVQPGTVFAPNPLRQAA
jgi:Protein of unknown function (DUF2917)